MKLSLALWWLLLAAAAVVVVALFHLFPDHPPDPNEGQVVNVVDGDTIDVLLTTRERVRVRYVGVNTPELGECYGELAKWRNDTLVHGRRVRLERDVSDTDVYGRLLRHVWLGDLNVGEQLVREGFATVMTVSPDVRHEVDYRTAQGEAAMMTQGMWFACPPEGETP